MSNTITNFRADQLKAMHEVVKCANDERIYNSWVAGYIPDEPQNDDFIFIAENVESYNKTIDLFINLVSKKGYRE